MPSTAASIPPNFGVDKNWPINVTRDSDVEVHPDGEALLPVVIILVRILEASG
jgi:hypothetical protein